MIQDQCTVLWQFLSVMVTNSPIYHQTQAIHIPSSDTQADCTQVEMNLRQDITKTVIIVATSLHNKPNLQNDCNMW